MADIDAVDNHMGRATSSTGIDHNTAVEVPHKYVGSNLASECEACGMLRIHSNHRGIDYDVPKQPTIADEASTIVYGDREQAYDDPNINFNKLAHMWTGVLLKKLAPGQTVTARDVALMQVCLKVSRESFNPKRDNRVDMVGYTLCLDRIVQAEDDASTK